ncbi:MAG: protein kinase [Pirellulales bacterium]
MATLTIDKFVDLVRKSGLVEEDRLSSVLEELSPEAKGERGGVSPPMSPDSEKLAQALVERNLLTAWQCERLQEGRHRGFILGKYKLLGLLGTGGMSSVYLAEHMLMQRRVAIKVLPRHKVGDSSYLARFRREAQAVAALDHRNIVRAYDIDNEGNTHYLVMEYVAGRDLNTMVKNDGPLDYDTAADYIRQAAEGLQHAHDANLIHRDIKPANLLVDARGTVKILDMGLARFIDEEQASLTRVHDENVLGTADYLAPEQAHDSHTADHRADIYSLGCTLYYLLTGHPPFREGTLAERIVKHQAEAPKSIYEDRPDAPQPLVDVCLRMMAKQPAARFQSAGEIARVLGTWLAGRGKQANPVTGATSPAGRPPPRRAPSAKPGQRQPDSPEDTVSDKTRITMKGQPGGGAPGVRKPGSSVRRATSPGMPPANKPPSGKSRGLPVARPIDESGKSKKPIPAVPIASAEPLAPRDPLSPLDPLGLNTPRSQRAPQWLWWAIAGGALLAVVLLVIVFLWQLN